MYYGTFASVSSILLLSHLCMCRRICFEQQKSWMLRVFQQGQDIYLRSFFQSTVAQGMQRELLEVLDYVVSDIQNEHFAAKANK